MTEVENYNTILSGYNDTLTVEDVTKILRVDRHTVYSLIESGTLYAVMPGKQYIISKRRLIDYILGDQPNV